jgi:TatD DNase family protein
LKPEKPKPERLTPDVLDSVKASKSAAKDPETGDSTHQNGVKEAVSESSDKPTTEPTTETTTETTESKRSESASPSAPNGKAAKPPVIPPPFYKSMIHPIKGEDGKIVPLIDIGANLTRLCYKDRMGSILERAKAAGVTTVLITGTSYRHSLDAIRLCQEWDGYQGVKLRATVGLHPHNVVGVKSGRWAEEWCLSLERLLKANREYVVAVGECGLDYNGKEFNSERDPHHQKEAFKQQLILADKLNLPVFAHCRGAHRDFLNVAAPWMKKARPVRLVVHCHTDPDPKHLKELLDAGAWIGLTGIITDKREGRFNENIINQVPRTRLMIETDSPFLLPSNACAIRDIDPEWQNEPCLLPFVAEKIAQVDTDNTPAAEVATHTTKNAIKFFGLEDPEVQA